MTANINLVKALVYPDGRRIEWRESDEWPLKQALAAPGRYYGDGGTIHGTEYLAVETDDLGNVVSVWFRCQMLPFKQVRVDEARAIAMRQADSLPAITGVEVCDNA